MEWGKLFATPERPPGNGGANATEQRRRSVPVTTRNGTVIAERTAVPDDSDGLTKATVAKMCEYIAAGADSVVQQCAAYAARPMARIFPHKASAFSFSSNTKYGACSMRATGSASVNLARAIFDCARSPPRMKDPAEDSTDSRWPGVVRQALGIPKLTYGGLRSARPERWSHVFGMVQLPNDAWFPLDCSHGCHLAGWSTVAHFALAGWDLNGNPSMFQCPRSNAIKRIHGRGMGQDDSSCAGTTRADGSVMTRVVYAAAVAGSRCYIPPEPSP